VSFEGPYPYGTAGGIEIIGAVEPQLVRVARGNSVIIFLHVNAPAVERIREQVEDVVRILGLSGLSLVAIIARQDGVVVDSNAGDMDFQGAIRINQVAPGVIELYIGDDGITSAMIGNAVIEAAHIAAGSIGTTELADEGVTAAKLAPGALPAGVYVPLDRDDFVNQVQGSLDGIFDTQYDRYYLTGRFSENTANQTLIFRFAVGGVDSAAVSYEFTMQYNHTSTSIAVGGGTGPYQNGQIHTALGASVFGTDVMWDMLIDGPALAGKTLWRGGAEIRHTVGSSMSLWAGAFDDVTIFDGISVFASSGLVSGYMIAYGILEDV
jgi:hypothetical protein